MPIELIEKDSIAIRNLIQPTKDIRIYIDTEKFIPDEKIQIYLQVEPEAICPKKEYLLQNYRLYSIILTFDKDVLEHCPNAILFNFYTETWLRESVYANIDITKKEFAISTLVGSKCLTEGHKIRQILYYSQYGLQALPITFYRSRQLPQLPEIGNNPFLDALDIHAKDILFTRYQFHLTIENSRQANYFTEKLIDCLITKTIPIYYGCPNIDLYFDTRGWILLERGLPSEVVELCSQLTSDYYNRFTETIEENYKRALHWKDNYKRLNEFLVSLD